MFDISVLILLAFTSAATTMAAFRGNDDDYQHVSNSLTSPEKYLFDQQRLIPDMDETQQQSLDLEPLPGYDDYPDEEEAERGFQRAVRLMPLKYGKFIGRRSQLDMADAGSGDQSTSSTGEMAPSSCDGDGNDDVNGKPGCKNSEKLVRDARASRGGHQLRSYARIGDRSMNPQDHVTRDIAEDRNRKQPSLQNVVRRAHSSFVRIGRAERLDGNTIKDDGPENVEEPINNGLAVVQFDDRQPASADRSASCINNDDDDKSPLGASLTRLRCHLSKIASGLGVQRPEVAREQINRGVDETTDGESSPLQTAPAKRYSSFVRIGRASRDVSRVQSDATKATKKSDLVATSETRLSTIDSTSLSGTSQKGEVEGYTSV